MKYVVTHDGAELEVTVVPRGDDRFDVTVGGRQCVADLRGAGGRSLFSLLLDQEAYELSITQTGDVHRVGVHGHDLSLTVESEQQRNARLVDSASGSAGPHTVNSVMPGRVVTLLVREGEAVEAGTPLLILEAMKMENEIRSQAAGVVTAVLVEEGATVVNGDPLVTIT